MRQVSETEKDRIPLAEVRQIAGRVGVECSSDSIYIDRDEIDREIAERIKKKEKGQALVCFVWLEFACVAG